MFMFGEIDCREGMMNSVAKGYHESMEQCQDELIAIYIKVLKQIKQKGRFRRLFIHCNLPVIPVTRSLVVNFNRRLMATLVPKELELGIIMVDPTDQLLLDKVEGVKPHQVAAAWGETRILNPDFVMDGTHMNVSYVHRVMEPTINAAIERVAKKAGK